MSTQPNAARSVLATVVGWVLVGVVVVVLFNFVIGTLFWLIRTVLIIVALLGLLTIYLKLKSPD